MYPGPASNHGPSTATGVTISDTDILQENLPHGVTFLSASGTGETAFDTTNGIWDIGSLDAGTTETLIITLSVDSSAADNLQISNTASLSTVNESQIDTTDGNDSQTVTTSVERQVDITVSKTDNADIIVAGSGHGNLVYTITATNAGPSTATGVTISDTDILQENLPIGMTLESATGTNGTEFDAASGTWTIESLNAGAAETLTVTLTVDPLAADGVRFSNTARLIAVNETDISPDNNSDTEQTAIGEQVDIVLTAREDSPRAVAGSGTGNIVHSIVVRNDGPSNASGLTVDIPGLTSALPDGIALVSEAATSDTTFDPATGIWHIGSLPGGQSRTLMLTFTAGSNTADDLPLTTTAVVSAVDQPESDIANDVASVTTTVSRQADISVTKSHNTSPVIV